MSFGDSAYESPAWGTIAENAEASQRAAFIKRTYLHLAGAVLAFCALEVVYVQSGLAERMLNMLWAQGQWAWLVVLGLFMAVSWMANSWALSSTSRGVQYAGLGLYVLIESLIFAPLLYVAAAFGGGDVIPTAGLITILMFAGLTVAVFVTGHDFSFLRTALIVGGFAAMGFIVLGIIFNFQLGVLFTIALIVLACGYILYDTSNVLHHYRTDQHVAAALALFASVALLFWYVLRLVMAMQRD